MVAGLLAAAGPVAGAAGGGAPDMSSASSGPATSGGSNAWTVNVTPPRRGPDWLPWAGVAVALGGIAYLWSRSK